MEFQINSYSNDNIENFLNKKRGIIYYWIFMFIVGCIGGYFAMGQIFDISYIISVLIYLIATILIFRSAIIPYMRTVNNTAIKIIFEESSITIVTEPIDLLFFYKKEKNLKFKVGDFGLRNYTLLRKYMIQIQGHLEYLIMEQKLL